MTSISESKDAATEDGDRVVPKWIGRGSSSDKLAN